MNVAIVGGGIFGTAIANIIARNGYTTYLWMRDPEQVAQTIEAGENLRYLPGHPLEAGVKPTAPGRSHQGRKSGFCCRAEFWLCLGMS